MLDGKTKYSTGKLKHRLLVTSGERNETVNRQRNT